LRSWVDIRRNRMSKRVKIFIEGMSRDEEEDRIITNAIGEYRLIDGVHILRYKENDLENNNSSENDKEINTIRISSTYVEMIKSGDNRTKMVFDLYKNTESVYDTPYGCLQFQIKTSKMVLEEKQDQIVMHMEYSLSHNDSHISDNRILIKAKEL
jgi:uncharacterized beta-barrel protein YwiB (DUF1934 family)